MINHTLDGRAPGEATLLVRSANLGSATSQITLTTAPDLIGGAGAAGGTDVSIAPFVTGANSATGGPADLVTYDLTTGFRTLTAAEYATGTPVGDTNNNHNLAGNVTLAGPVGINAAKLSATGQTLSLGGSTLTVKSGALLAAATATPGSSAVRDGTLEFGSAEGIITTAGGHDLAVAAVVNGSNGLTKSGAGVLTLSGTNTYSGTTALNGGILAIESEANLGVLTNRLVLSGGTLRPSATMTGLDVTKPVTLRAAARAGVGGFDIPTGGTFAIPGFVDGAGVLVKRGAGTLVLANNGNSYSGGTQVLDGVLSIADGAALGNVARADSDGFAAALTLDGGTLRATGTQV